MADDSEKLFDPTPRRRQQARDEGHVAQSSDLGSAILLLTGVLLLMLLGKPVVEFTAQFMRQQLGEASTLAPTQQSVVLESRLLLDQLGRALLPLLGLLVVAGVLASALQFGFLLVPGRIAPDGGRVSLARGLERVFSLSGGMRLGFGMLKLAVVVGVAALVAWNGRDDITRASALDTPQLARFLAESLLGMAWWIGVALLALALGDYAFQRWRHEQSLRMTYQEFREEMRDLERAPLVDARRRLLYDQARVDRVGASDSIQRGLVAREGRA